jgi:hypothetical protein
MNVAEAVSVQYFAVYPGGRRCEVTLQDALTFGKKWEGEDDVRLITKLVSSPAPVLGTLEHG